MGNQLSHVCRAEDSFIAAVGSRARRRRTARLLVQLFGHGIRGRKGPSGASHGGEAQCGQSFEEGGSSRAAFVEFLNSL